MTARVYNNDVQSSVTERAVPCCDTGTGGEAAAGSGCDVTAVRLC